MPPTVEVERPAGPARKERRGHAPRIVYVLPKANFFSQGRRGRVTHATGVVNGLVACGASVTVVSSEGMADYLPATDSVSSVAVRNEADKRRWFKHLLGTLRAIVEEQKPDSVIIRYAASNGFRLARLMRSFDQTVWCFELNSLGAHSLSHLPGVLHDALRRFECASLARADLIYVVSEQLKADLARTAPSLSGRIAVVPNGGPAPMRVQWKENDDQRALPLYYLGIFQSYYELDLVVRRFQSLKRRISGLELHLYGDGPQETELRKAAGDTPGIHLHGRYRLDHLVESREFSKDGILLLPYCRDGVSTIGSPTKLFEYMALGLPIVASSVGQLKDILLDGETAVLYEAGNGEQFERAVARLAGDSTLRRKLAENIRTEYPSHTWPSRMEGLLSRLMVEHDKKCNR